MPISSRPLWPSSHADAQADIQCWQAVLPASAAHGGPAVPPADLARWRATLNDEERARADRFHFARDRERFVLARALLRGVLGTLTGQDPSALRFGQGAQGKPFVARADGSDAGIAFNLSHTDDLVLLAVHRDGLPLGIDVESTQRRAPLAVVRRQFAPVEADALEALVDPSAQVHHFWSCWTLKESLIKATGEGLHTPLSRFGFVLRPEGRIDLQAQAGTPEGDTPWWFGQWRPSPQHLAALCVAVAPGASCAPPRLQAWQGWPGEALAPLPVTWLARSAG